MNDEPVTPGKPEQPRYSVRGLLITTTAVALLAAVGGVVYRRLDPNNRTILLAFWSACGAAIPAMWWFALRRELKQATRYAKDPDVRFIVPVTGEAPVKHRAPWKRWLLGVGCAGFYLAQYSSMVLNQSRHTYFFSWQSSNILGLAFMFLLGALVVSEFVVRTLIRKSAGRAGLTDEGIKFQQRVIPWRHIHAVKRTEADPAVLFLRRYDGDLHLRPGKDQSAAVEVFIRTHTGHVESPSEP